MGVLTSIFSAFVNQQETAMKMTVPAPPANSPSASPPSHRPILWGLCVGVILGLSVHALKKFAGVDLCEATPVLAVTHLIGSLFLRLMQMVVLPLVVSAIYLAIVDVGDLRRFGRIGLTTLGFTALLSISAVMIGLVLVNVVRPGKVLGKDANDALTAMWSGEAEGGGDQGAAATPLQNVLIDLLPQNPLQEMVGAMDGSSPGNGMLAVMAFAIFCGIAASIRAAETAALTSSLRGVYEVCMTIIGWAVRLAPLATGCLVFNVTATLGFSVFAVLAPFVFVVLAGLLVQLLVVYSTVLRVFGGISPWTFFRLVTEAMVVAFSTSSSSATLSTSIKVAQDRLRLNPETANFVLTAGATGNQNGTALFEGVVVLFLAQVANVELSVGQQFLVVLMSILSGIGTAGVPGGSIPMITVLLGNLQIPSGSIVLVLGVDRFLDMSRTLVNVVGDLVVASCVDNQNRNR